ncbi:hypothetical protein J4Q44_G00346540, partial [Coregonus suidteri]
MGGVREFLLFVLTVVVFKVSCSPVGKSQKQDKVSLQRRLGDYLETNEVASQDSPNYGSSLANDDLASAEKMRRWSDDYGNSPTATTG